jgi:hypothetical protein
VRWSFDNRNRARGEALDRETSGTRKIVFLKGNEIHSPTLLKHENVFYHVREGDLFVKLQGVKKTLLRLLRTGDAAQAQVKPITEETGYANISQTPG